MERRDSGERSEDGTTVGLPGGFDRRLPCRRVGIRRGLLQHFPDRVPSQVRRDSARGRPPAQACPPLRRLLRGLSRRGCFIADNHKVQCDYQERELELHAPHRVRLAGGKVPLPPVHHEDGTQHDGDDEEAAEAGAECRE